MSAHQLVTRVDAVSNELEALTRRDAARKAPGVAQVSRSFLVIFLLYGLVVPLVIGLFFLIVTLQKARTLTLLRAIGARSKTLVWALLLQVLVVVGLGVAIGTLLYLPVSFQRVGSIPLHFDVDRGGRLGIGHPGARRRQLVVLGPPGAAHRADRGALGRGVGLVRIALREMRRRPARFATAAALLTLIAMLLMLLGGLLDGLIQRSTGAIRAQRADLVVFSATAEKSFLRSRITPEVRAQVEAVPGVTGVGGIGVTQLGARVPGNGPRDLVDVALFGYQRAPRGVPSPPAAGTAYADSILRDEGVKRGDTLQLGPARTPVHVVGFVDNVSYSGAGSLWASADDVARRAERQPAGVVGRFRRVPDARRAHRPATRRRSRAAIDRATGGATETVSATEAADSIGGVRQQRSVFNQIIGVTLVIAIVVVALFFALLTVERIGLYGMLKAIGARSRTLFGGVVCRPWWSRSSRRRSAPASRCALDRTCCRRARSRTSCSRAA